LRALFFLLLAANIALAAMVAMGPAASGERHVFEPLNAEKIRLVEAGAAPAPTAVAAAPAPRACLEWGSFNSADLSRAQAELAKLRIEDRLSVKEVEEPSGFWVYVPPSETRQETNKKVAELRIKGITDLFVIQDANSRWKNAISLGMFHTEDAAEKHLAELTRKGVKNAIAGPRDSTVKRSVFVLRDPDDALAAQLVELAREFQDTNLKATACEPGG
jgi:sporulation related protein